MESNNTRLYKNWWLLFTKGLIISGYGVVYLLKLFNFKILIQSFIIISIINGILILFGTFHYRKTNAHWFYWLIEGTFDFILGLAGIVFIMSMKLFSYLIVNLLFIQVIAFWALIHGIIHTLSAYKVKHYVPTAQFALFSGVGVIILSLIIFFKPILFTQPDSYFISVFCIVIGLLLAFISVVLRKLYSE
jgi:uncharacterized membrane protein HdeD (DUF308 family)